MKLLQWLFKRPLIKKEIDPWTEGEFSDSYVARYRVELEKVAEMLSDKLHLPITIRLNTNGRCAEIVTETGFTFAQVRVHGEFGMPYEILVDTFYPLTDELKEAIGDLLDVPITMWRSDPRKYKAGCIKFKTFCEMPVPQYQH